MSWLASFFEIVFTALLIAVSNELGTYHIYLVQSSVFLNMKWTFSVLCTHQLDWMCHHLSSRFSNMSECPSDFLQGTLMGPNCHHRPRNPIRLPLPLSPRCVSPPTRTVCIRCDACFVLQICFYMLFISPHLFWIFFLKNEDTYFPLFKEFQNVFPR